MPFSMTWGERTEFRVRVESEGKGRKAAAVRILKSYNSDYNNLNYNNQIPVSNMIASAKAKESFQSPTTFL